MLPSTQTGVWTLGAERRASITVQTPRHASPNDPVIRLAVSSDATVPPSCLQGRNARSISFDPRSDAAGRSGKRRCHANPELHGDEARLCADRTRVLPSYAVDAISQLVCVCRHGGGQTVQRAVQGGFHSHWNFHRKWCLGRVSSRYGIGRTGCSVHTRQTWPGVAVSSDCQKSRSHRISFNSVGVSGSPVSGRSFSR